jgi:16S rRNA (cytosine1402-N4)-methyltransferase
VNSDGGLHIPVMVHEATTCLNLRPGGVYVDGTFGRGGYTKEMLNHEAGVRVIGIDRDPSAEAAALQLQNEFGDRFQFVRGVFSQIDEHLQALNYPTVDGIILDLGVSSPQLDEAERGFSFRQDGPLDMRMSQSGLTAETIVNTWSESELADVIFHYGGERLSRKVARAIIAARANKVIRTTLELADIVRSVVPRDRASDIDGATRTFQAIRIAVNDELGELETFLRKAPDVLNPGGRLGIVSFHSLEDGCVKREFRKWCEPMHNSSRHLPNINVCEQKFKYVKLSGITAGESEIKQNPRSRSARLRVVEKLLTNKEREFETER